MPRTRCWRCAAHLTGRAPLARVVADGTSVPASAQPPDLADVRGQMRREARARDRRGRRALAADGGSAGIGKIDAGTAHRRHPAAARRSGGAGDRRGAVAGRRASTCRAGGGRRSARRTTRRAAVALVGGGSDPRPGEISLAHHGVLFLDELPEFDRRVLEVLREPLETGRDHASRARRGMQFPARSSWWPR